MNYLDSKIWTMHADEADPDGAYLCLNGKSMQWGFKNKIEAMCMALQSYEPMRALLLELTLPNVNIEDLRQRALIVLSPRAPELPV